MTLDKFARGLAGALIGTIALASTAMAQTTELRLGHLDVDISPAGISI